MSGNKKSVYMSDLTLERLQEMAEKNSTSTSYEVARAVQHQAMFDRINIEVSPVAAVALAMGRADLIRLIIMNNGHVVISVKEIAYQGVDGSPGILKPTADALDEYGKTGRTDFSFEKAIGRVRPDSDGFGNNTNFSDTVLGPMSAKGMLGKWAATIADDSRQCLLDYYSKDRKGSFGDKDPEVKAYMRFTDMKKKFVYLTPVLEDMTNVRLYGIEDILIAVYGVDSDEVVLFREFVRLTHKDMFEAEDMWDDAVHVPQIRAILFKPKS